MTTGWQHWIAAGAGAVVAGGLSAGALAYASRWPGSQIFGSALVAPHLPGELALTFDDGPHPMWTPRLLEMLARHEARASFFLIGSFAAGQLSSIREMHAAGHCLGNHTWSIFKTDTP